MYANLQKYVLMFNENKPKQKILVSETKIHTCREVTFIEVSALRVRNVYLWGMKQQRCARTHLEK